MSVNEMFDDKRKFIEYKMLSLYRMPYEDCTIYDATLSMGNTYCFIDVNGKKRGCDKCKCYDPKGNHTGYHQHGGNCYCNWWSFNETTIKTFLHKLELLKQINSIDSIE